MDWKTWDRNAVELRTGWYVRLKSGLPRGWSERVGIIKIPINDQGRLDN